MDGKDGIHSLIRALHIMGAASRYAPPSVFRGGKTERGINDHDPVGAPLIHASRV